MGTNYYWKKQNKDFSKNHPINHIGKRSAAGLYCWDCGTTFCADGTNYVHSGTNHWHKECPFCGKGKEDEPLEKSAIGTELGFNKEGLKHHGVGLVCSFIWVIMKYKNDIIRQAEKDYLCGVEPYKIIIDEYGVEYTAQEFLKILEDCPIEYQNCAEFC